MLSKFIRISCAVGAAASMMVATHAVAATTGQSGNHPTIGKNHIAVQLWTVRKYSDSREHIDYMLGKLEEIGFSAVELAGFWNLTGADWKDLLAQHHMTVTSVHTNQFELGAEGGVQKVIDNMHQIGSNKIVYAYSTTEMENTASRAAFIKQLKIYKRQFAAAGIDMFYHNHNMEFVRTDKGGLAYDDILQKTQLGAELDVHWAARAGVAPALMIDKLGWKMKFMHLKDIGLGAAPNLEQPTVRPVVFEELGNGNLNWPSIIAAAKRAGCDWYVIEQDDNFINDEPLESLKVSFDFLTQGFTR